MTTFTEEMMRPSYDFVDSLDRSLLGSLAVSREALAVEDAHLRLTMIVPNNIWLFTIAIEDYAAHSELLFWWRRRTDLDDETAEKFSEYMDSIPTEKIKGHVNSLESVNDNPVMLPYFEAGIWDTELITSLMADSVDPSLALDAIGTVGSQ